MSRPWLHQDDVDWRRTPILEIMFEGTCHYASTPLRHYAATMQLHCYELWHYATVPASIQIRSGRCPGQARLSLWRRWSRSRTLDRWSFSNFVSFVASGSDRWVCPTQATSFIGDSSSKSFPKFFFIVESRKRKSNCKSVRVMVSETEREYLRERVCACTCVCECVWGRKKNYFSRLEEKRWLGLTNMFWLSAFGKGEKVFFLTRNQSRRRSINDF